MLSELAYLFGDGRINVLIYHLKLGEMEIAMQAAAVSLTSTSAITPRLSASAVTPQCRPARCQVVSLGSHDVLATSRLSGASSTSGRSNLTSGWRVKRIATPVCQAALFEFLKRSNKNDKELVKGKLLLEIAKVDRGAEATPDDQKRIDQIARELEALNPTKEPLNSPLINGKWMLLYTTSESILKKNRQKFLRPQGPIYQAINTDTLRAQNIETWPFFNQVTANLDPLNSRRTVVNFDYFKIGGLLAAGNTGCIISCRMQIDSSRLETGRSAIDEKQSQESDRKPRSGAGAKMQDWCGLCGDGNGWIQCGKCTGSGGFATKPGLAGAKGTVGWACCKTCFGRTVVPCILCGVHDVQEWESWQQLLRRGPNKTKT